MKAWLKLPTPALVILAIVVLITAIALLYNAYERDGYYSGIAFQNYIESAEANGDTGEIIRNYEQAVRSLNLTLIITGWVLLGVTAYLLYVTWLVHNERDE